MRDYFFLAFLPFILYPMFKRPFISLGMWVWTAMFFPNAWLYGVAKDIRYNLLFTGVAVIGYLAMKHKPSYRMGAISSFVLLFFAWTTLSTVFTIGNPEMAWEIWVRFSKVVLLFFFVTLIVEKKLHLDFLLWCVVFSIGAYAGLEALKYIFTGGGHKIAGFAGHVLGDRNELSIAFVMTLPLCLYLLGEYGANSKALRFGLLGLMGLIVIAVVGTQSRGGFIALLGLGAYLFAKSERKILLGFAILLTAGIIANIVTEEWMSRMDTIGEADEDASFMGRVVAWKLSFILAMNHPILGGGFKALENFAVWTDLSRDFFSYGFFYTGDALPSTVKARAAHSIYFQVMGEHGFGGLAIYIGFLYLILRTARKVATEARARGAPDWIPKFATAAQLSVFAFCLGGAALNFAYFDLLFALAGAVAVLKFRILPAELKRLSQV